MSRPFLVNIHIPKCGGTTYLEILQRNFRDRFDSAYSHIWRPYFTSEQILNYIVNDPRFDAFSSHELSLDLPFDSDLVQLICTVSLRNPVERTISHYFFERQRGTTKFKDTIDLSLNDFLAGLLKREDHWLINYQTKSLIQNTNLQSARDIVEYAERVHLVPIPVNRFSESMVMLERKFPDWFRNCVYRRENRSVHTEKADQGLKEALIRRNDQDVLLLQWANDLIDKFISTDPGGFHEHLSRFENRCRRFAFRASIIGQLRGFTHRIRGLGRRA